jgi:hypothetical protein
VNKFDVGLVTVTCAGRTARYTEEHSDGAVKEGKATLAELETPDGFKGTLGLLEWIDGSAEMKLVDFARGPDGYRRLESAGKAQVTIQGTHWLVMVRALKIGEKKYFTLHNATLNELSAVIKEDARALLTAFENTEVGRYGDLKPDATKAHADGLGIRVPAGEMDALAAMYAMTRVATIMTNFGIDTVIGMD